MQQVSERTRPYLVIQAMDALGIAGCLARHGEEEGKQCLLTCYGDRCFPDSMAFERDGDTSREVSFMLIDNETEVQRVCMVTVSGLIACH